MPNETTIPVPIGGGSGISVMYSIMYVSFGIALFAVVVIAVSLAVIKCRRIKRQRQGEEMLNEMPVIIPRDERGDVTDFDEL